MENNPLLLYTVYDHPSDYPDSYIVRRQRILPGKVEFDDRFFFQSPHLNTAMEMMLTLRLVRLERHPEDDPVILECWI